MQTWRLIRDKNHDGITNMATDEAISIACGEEKSLPTLRFYGWKTPVVSIGYGQRAESDIDLKYCGSAGIDIVKRPTGGRAVLHENELTFSINSSIENPLFSKNILKSHKKISEAILLGLNRMGINAKLQYKSKNRQSRNSRGLPPWWTSRKISATKNTDFISKGLKEINRHPVCFSAPSIYELVVDGKKIVGCAQRRFKKSFLEHGSIPLKLDRRKLASIFMYRNFNVEILRSLRSLRMTAEQKCHSEPFACHSERSEESLSSAQDKLREESNLRNNLSFSENKTDSLYLENMAGLNELGLNSFSLDQLIENFLKGFEQHFGITFKEDSLSNYEIEMMEKKRKKFDRITGLTG